MQIDSHTTPTRMARALASYIEDPERIRSEVLSEFTSAPPVERIAEMRADHLARRGSSEPHCLCDRYDLEAVRKAAEYANQRFLTALRSARMERGA